MSMPKTAIYAGSFDPITNGHCDIITRARRVFDQLVIVVMPHSQKKAWLSLEPRMMLVRAAVQADPGCQVVTGTGLLAQYAKTHGITTLIRGLRAVSDFDYEAQMALTNRDIYTALDTVFFMTSRAYTYLSSSIVREMATHHAPVDKLVPPCVQAYLDTL